MFEFKLQIGCLIVVLYFIVAYIRETTAHKVKCNRIFDVMLVVAPWSIIFDGITAWTVNHQDIVPAGLNLFCHAMFLILMDGVVILFFLYMVDCTVGIRSWKRLLAALAPGLVSIAGILGFLHELHYVEGTTTNYSMGISVIVCFASLFVHFVLICVLFFVNHRTIERVRIFDIIVFIVIILGVLLIQIFFPEILISSLLPMFCLIVIYMAFENPSFIRLQRYNAEMVTGFATLVENRDDNTGGHIRRTKGYVEIILNELKKKNDYKKILTKDYINHVKNAAPMHDIGKISTPDQILQKPGKLTDEEYEIMKKHAPVGGDIIRETFAGLDDPEYQQIAYEVARYHHEKWNGKGYPDGLRGTEIPLHARIMAVADVFDAVSAKRCYRDALPLETCFRIIWEGAGEDFDPEIVEVFLNARARVEEYYRNDGNRELNS